MSVQVSSGRLALDHEVLLSYFVNNKNQKLTRVSQARLIDISDAGLCMEVSLVDSGLFMESREKLYILCKEIELQIFCRSHPINISVPGHIKWFQRTKEFEISEDNDKICVGVLFRVENNAQRAEIVELVRHLRNDMVNCRTCNANISADAVLCYNCGTKPVRKRTFFRKMINGLLLDNEDA